MELKKNESMAKLKELKLKEIFKNMDQKLRAKKFAPLSQSQLSLENKT